MTIKANGRSALILAAGLFVCFASPSQAATSASDTASSKSDTVGAPIALNKYTKHATHHWKKLAHGKSSKVASKSSADKNTADAAADDGDSSPVIPSSDIPPLVANANAQLAAADAPGSSAKAMSARASNILQTAPDNPPADPQAAAATSQDNSQVVSADQLNDVDRSLRQSDAAAHQSDAAAHQGDAPATTLAMASADPPAPAASNESSTWDQTSLIGKIFIGFGALLTMASAARMFMA
jgi:hypothetical protein